MRIPFINACALAGILSLGGCASEKRYDGPRLPRSQIAIVHQHLNDDRYPEGYGAEIVELDGQRTSPSRQNYFEVLPGSHKLVIRYAAGMWSSKNACVATFVAEPGATYFAIAERGPVAADYHQGEMGWRAYVVRDDAADASAGSIEAQCIHSN